MISVEEFRTLRLSQFASEGDVQPLLHRELFARTWVGETAEGVELVSQPDRSDAARAIVVPFSDQSGGLADVILQRIGLPLRPGMTESEVAAVLGPPWRTHVVGDEGKATMHKQGRRGEFTVTCVVWRDRGLKEVIVSVGEAKREGTE